LDKALEEFKDLLDEEADKLLKEKVNKGMNITKKLATEMRIMKMKKK
jgi:hypothetical protein